MVKGDWGRPVRILQETPDDLWEVEALYDLSFAPGRFALSSYQLRDGVEKVGALCMIARDDFDVIVGAIRYWPIMAGSHPALLLGPIAIHPIRQGEGIGAALMAASLDKARAIGWKRVILVGDPPYYSKFGFEPIADRVAFPEPVNPARVLGLALLDGGMDGVEGRVTKWPEGREVSGVSIA